MSERATTVEVGIDSPGNGGRFSRLKGAVNGQLRSKLLRNIMTVVTGTAGAQALTMLFMPIITRLYGPEAYGVLGVFMGATLMLIPIAALTYPTAIVLPKRDADARAIVRLSLLLAVVVASLVAIALYFGGTAAVEFMGIASISPYLMLLPVVMFFGACLESAQQWLIRKQLFRVTAKVAITHSLLHNSIRSVGGLLMATPTVLVVTTAFGQLLHAVMLFLGIRAHNARTDLVEERRVEPPPRLLEPAKTYIDFPMFRAPQILINAVSQNMPTLVLAAYFGPAVAGFFALCKQALTMPTHLIGKSVADVYYPKLIQAIHRQEPITGMLAKAVAGLAVIGLFPFGFVFLTGPWLFAFVFGAEWETAGHFARWMALAEYAIFISRPCTVAFPALQMQRLSLCFEIFSTSLRLTALFVGAAVLGEGLSTVIAFSFASILIYCVLIAIALFEANRRYAHGYRRD
jgi:O-antigen/teichoic acid export membrane protein